MCVHEYYGKYVEVKGQLVGVSSLPGPGGPKGSNLDRQVQQQIPLPTISLPQQIFLSPPTSSSLRTNAVATDCYDNRSDVAVNVVLLSSMLI